MPDPMYELHYGGHWKLKDVPPGRLFRLPDDNIAMTTEYGDNNGFRHKYLLFSGESCWADPETEVIVLELVPSDIHRYASKPTDTAAVEEQDVPEASRRFAAGDMKAFDKPSEEAGLYGGKLNSIWEHD